MPYMLDLKIIPDWISCKQGKLGAFGTNMLMNCQQMILKEGLFRKHTEQFPVSNIGHLDQSLEGVSKMLHKIIMEITVTTTNKQTNATSKERIFHSILPRKGSTDHILTYPKEHSATVVAMITCLIPFILNHYKDSTKKWFSSHTLNGSLGSKWDEKTGAVIMPNNKVVQDRLSSEFWWLQDTLQGVEDYAAAKPTRPVGCNSNAAGHHMNMGSQVTFLKNMEMTHMYDPKDNPNDNHSSSSSSKASSDSISNEDSSDNKVQTKGSSTSKEESGSGSNSDTGAI
jgi:hypothetical protein